LENRPVRGRSPPGRGPADKELRLKANPVGRVPSRGDPAAVFKTSSRRNQVARLAILALFRGAFPKV
jgi:hypothetical protein